jgi:hypothetical protein
LTQLLAETIKPEVEERGFNLVEEDDVAFTMALCREIHRLYGSYQEGDLPLTEQVWAGLNLSQTAVVTLRSTINSGMPSMRLDVAAAQAREMLAVLFGAEAMAQRPTFRTKKVDSGIEPTKSVTSVHPSGARALPSPVESDLAVPTVAVPTFAVPTLAVSTLAVPTLADRWNAVWTRRSLLIRFVTGLVGCLLLAVAVDIPLTVLALFPDHLTVLCVVYALAVIAAWLRRRLKVTVRLASRVAATGH